MLCYYTLVALRGFDPHRFDSLTPFFLYAGELLRAPEVGVLRTNGGVAKEDQ